MISSVVGTGTLGNTGDGGLATSARINSPLNVIVDSAGNAYFADYGSCVVRKINTSGIISTVAGTGTCSISTDGGQATSTALYQPSGLAIDSSDNLYIAEFNAARVRRVNSSGVISTFAGTGTAGSTGDGGAATSAKVTRPVALAFDSAQNLYIADSGNNRIRKVSGGVITTVVGTGTAGSTGDGGQATAAQIAVPYGVTLDSAGNLYVAELSGNRVRKVDTTGVITTIAGTGTAAYSGDGGLATAAQLKNPAAVAVDAQGIIYIADAGNYRIRQITAGTITTIAGTGTNGFSGDGGPATSAKIGLCYGLYVTSSGRLYFGDYSNHVVRVLSVSRVSTLPSTAVNASSAATSLEFGSVSGLGSTVSLQFGSEFSVNSAGCSYTSTPSFQANCPVTFTPLYPGLRWDALILKDSGGTVVATQYLYGLGQGSLPAITPGVISTLNTGAIGAVSSEGVVFDPSGNMYVSDGPNNRIVKNASGTFSTLTITGATLSNPKGLVSDGSGNLYVSDSGNNRVLRIAADGTATDLAITGLLAPSGLAIDTSRTLYIADTGNARIITYTLSGATATLVVTPTTLVSPISLAFADDGTLYISDPGASSIVKVTSSGVCTTVTVTGATLSSPAGLATDRAGNVYVANSGTNVVYRMKADGSLLAVAGTGTAGNSGDGGVATSAAISAPKAVVIGRSGSIYFSDTANGTIRQVAGTPTVAFPDTAVNGTNSQSVLFSNIGNTALTFPASFNFAQSPSKFSLINSGGSDCSALLSSSLAAAATCTLQSQFAPTAAGLSSDNVALTGGSQIAFRGSGIAVAISSVNTNSLSFGSQTVSTTSTGQTVTLSNTGTGTLNIASAVLSGANASEFALTNNCGATLAASANCTIAVAFTPASIAAKTATLTITASDAVSSANLSQTISLSGTGVGTGTASLSTSTISFGNVTSSTTSTSQTLTITNSGTGVLNITSAVVSGANAADFTAVNNCGATLAIGAQCTVSLTFQPSTMAAEAATLTVTTADATTLTPVTGTVALSGTGVGTGTATVTATPINFGTINSGSTSGSQTVTITNSGTGVLNITSAVISGVNAADFTPVNNCGATLAVGAQCTVSLTFHPSTMAAEAATLTVTTADATTLTPVTSTVALSGTGVGTGTATVITTPINFGNVTSGSTSTLRSVTVTNSGTGVLNITSAVISGANAADFTLVNSCGATLAIGAQCTVSVTFHPSTMSAEAATLTVTTADATELTPVTSTIALSGTGVGTGTATVNTTPINFGNVASGSTSTSQTVTIANSGTGLLNITSAVISGTNAADYSLVNSCGATLAVGAQCTISLTFHPSIMAAESATLTVTTADAITLISATSTVALSGTGVGTGAGTVNTTPINFGSVTSGSTSTSQTVAIANSGTGVLSISSAVVSGANAADFALVNSCGTTLIAGTSCTVSLTFTPSTTSAEQATLTVTTADAITLAPVVSTIVLSGTGTAPASGNASLSVSSLMFASTTPGATSALQIVTLTNNGGGPLNIASAALTGTDANSFAITNNCGSSLAAGASCTVQVTFAPTSTGNKSANLMFTFGSGQTATTSAVTLSGISSAATGTVPTGLMKITSVHSGRALDILNASTLNGSPVQQYDYLSGTNQMWQAVPVDSTYYKIVNISSGKVLDGAGASLRDGVMVQQWNYLGGDNQKWQFIPQEDGSFEIVNKASGKALDVLNVSMANQARIQLWTYNATDNQKWQLAAVTTPTPTVQYYTISSLATGRVLDVVGVSSRDQAPIQQYDYLHGFNQQWALTPIANGYYSIVNRLSGKALDATNAGTNDGTPVQQYTYVGGENQQWQLVATANGYYQIVNKLSGKSLDVTGMSSANGALLQTYTYWGGPNQQFQLTAVVEP